MIKNALDIQQISVILSLKLVEQAQGTSVLVYINQLAALMIDTTDCVNGDSCETVLCTPDVSCEYKKICTNVNPSER